MKNCINAFVILTILASSFPAWAACPAGGECYTAKEAQVCLLCLDEQAALRAASRAKEAERNASIAMQNTLAGQLEECRLDRRAWQDRAIQAERRPGWVWVVTIGAGALILGGVAGGLAL